MRRSLYLEGDGGFCIEAEAASSLLRPGEVAGKAEDGKAHGGTYLANPGALTLELSVERGGEYELQLRVRKDAKTWRAHDAKINPDAGEKRSPEIAVVELDGKALPRLALTPFEKPAAVWRWQQLCTLKLTPGLHEIGIGELPGFHLDRVVLVRKEQGKADGDLAMFGDGDQDAGDADDAMLDDLSAEIVSSGLDELPPSRVRLVKRAHVVTAGIRPLAVAAWRRLSVEGDFAGLPPSQAVSVDGGKTWRDLPATGDLSGVPASGDGSDSLQIRLAWEPGYPQEPPAVTRVRVEYESGDSDPVTVAGPRLQLQFHGDSGALYGIRSASDGSWLGLPAPRTLFRLGWRGKGDSEGRTLSSDNFRLSRWETPAGAVPNRAVATFAHAELGLSVTCSVQAASEAGRPWTWTLTAVNEGDGTVRWVAFPEFAGLLCGGTYLLPESLWSVSGSGVFPGRLSMGFVFAHDGETGLSLASLDQTLTGVELTAKDNEGSGLVAARSFGIVPPGSTRTYEYSMAVGPADWHWAADLYREWAMSWMERPEWPEWARRTDGWYNLLSDTEAALLDRRSTTLFEDARWLGLPHLQLWVGCGDGEFVGRMPYLSPRLGTPEMSKRDSERIRELGGHIGHYIQAREWRADFATTNMIGFIPRRYFPESFVVEDAEWSRRNTIQGWGECQIMCPSSTEWQAHTARHAGERVSLFGNDAAYFDQMGCTVMSCGKAAHGHGDEYHVSGRGYTEMARKSLAAMRAHNPEVAIAQEGMSAATGQHAHFHLASSRPYREHGRQFLYTFPDAAICRGYGNGVYQWQGSPLRSFLRDLYVFHRFEIPAYDPYVRDIVLLRQRVRDWQYDGRYMDDVGLDLSIPGEPPAGHHTRARWFLYEHAGTQGILINWRNEERLEGCGIRLSRSVLPFAPSGRAIAYYDDGTVESVNCTVEDSVVALDLPVREVGTLLVPGPVARGQALRCFAYQSYEHGPDRLVLGTVNITGNPISAEWSIDAPRGFELEATKGNIDVPAYAFERVEVPLVALSEAQAMADATVTWRYALGGSVPADGGRASPRAAADAGKAMTRSVAALVSPPLRNGTMELDENGDGSPDSWWNFNKSFCHIIHRYADDVDMRSLPAVHDTTVKRSGSASVRVPPPMEYALTVDSPFGRKGGKHTWPGEVTQRLYLKPATRYRVQAHARAQTGRAVCRVRCAGRTTAPVQLRPGEWVPVTLEFETASPVTATTLTLINASKDGAPVWFDDVTVAELPSAP